MRSTRDLQINDTITTVRIMNRPLEDVGRVILRQIYLRVQPTVICIRQIFYRDNFACYREARCDHRKVGNDNLEVVFASRINRIPVGVRVAVFSTATTRNLVVTAITDRYRILSLQFTDGVDDNMVNTITSVDRRKRIFINTRCGDIDAVDSGSLTFLDVILLVVVVRRMDNNRQHVYTIKLVVLRQAAVVVRTGLRDDNTIQTTVISPDEGIRLTQFNGISEQIRRMNSEVE